MDTQVSNIIIQLFTPTARHLKRYVRRRIDFESQLAPVVPDSFLNQLIPATDRVVSLDHNSQIYKETIEALNKTEQAVITANDYEDSTDKEQRIAELSAARRLLSSTRVRVGAITAVAGPVLVWLAERFAGGLVGQLASAAWKLVSTLIGI